MSHIGQRYNYHSFFKECNWLEFYRDAKEVIPVNSTEPCGKDIYICMFVDIEHAGDRVSCRSMNGSLIYVNTAVVQ